MYVQALACEPHGADVAKDSHKSGAAQIHGMT